jgi:Uncharacterised nucleotidyltransferase
MRITNCEQTSDARRRLCIIVAIRVPIDSGLRLFVYLSEPTSMAELLATSPRSSAARQGENEFDLLRTLAAAELISERRERIANWNLSALNWSEVLRLAEHHGVLAIAARNLTEYGRGLPPEIERSLRSAYEENLRRSLRFTAELTRVTQYFQKKQLRAIPYKGPVLAQSVYHDLGLRSFSDLDFLISPMDFERAKQALAEIGYRPSAELTPAVERFWLRIGYERSFDGAAGMNLVELQWALLPYFYAVDVGMEGLLARAGRAVVGECEVSSLAPEDLLLVLCLHAAKHLWTRLIWLSDIAETLRTWTIDYSLVSSRARALGIARILGVSFWLAKNVLQAQLSKPAEEVIASDRNVSILGLEFAARLARGAAYDFESTEYFRLILKLRERRRDQMRYLWRLVWTPGSRDLGAGQLPEKFFPLYRVVRIGRLMQK